MGLSPLSRGTEMLHVPLVHVAPAPNPTGSKQDHLQSMSKKSIMAPCQSVDVTARRMAFTSVAAASSGASQPAGAMQNLQMLSRSSARDATFVVK